MTLSVFVVKNESNTFSRCSALMPEPVSVMVIFTFFPMDAVVMVRFPPSGMASMALEIRFKNTWRS